ncbi:zinc finger CCCH domain-containing protein 14-like isoform X2 [Tripterygium wilfordii]|uniref:zinc finger CCCH domain-containing protein 14-like isoform X2 n=1 Tax=Tripterygium wilfordii TaxID=458696 RepID=UPI0018F80248|nr:zinc finger CCCH domain-containing protein 14-like isoform X2 [Tripterygium wilfordii]
MDSLYNSKLQKLQSLSGTVSPINTHFYKDSALLRYLRTGSPVATSTDAFSSPAIARKRQYSSSSSSGNSGSANRTPSPLSAIENLERTTRTGSPTAVEDDVLVMDGILVGSVPAGRASRSASSLSLDSGGGLSSNTSPGKICRFWMEFGYCRYGYNCQFAHGKEELRPGRFPNKSKPENLPMRQSFPGTGSSPYGTGLPPYSPKSRFGHPITVQPAFAIDQPEYPFRSPSLTTKTEHFSKIPGSPSVNFRPEESNILSTTITSRVKYWSPQDDGIEVFLPCHSDKPPSREDVDAYIDHFLNGPTSGSRLPVFTKLWLE